MRKPWYRVRFYSYADDPRPLVFPPVGPYWITGDDGACVSIVAYVRHMGQVEEQWPEATEVDVLSEHERPEFCGRMPRPDWWPEEPAIDAILAPSAGDTEPAPGA